MHKAFGIPLTAWSHPDGGLVRGDVGLGAGLWLDRRCLVVRRVDAWVGGGDELYGLGLFLQDTSSDT